ncbi:hypothetical protein BCR44DRAFT_1439381 [Catenaria anguillulae PL171]|uniref:Uncharacterized protein n=1 Tax=Catenaria anguillulae PL171 TaxID=765915 RepID=A0A1Y2HIC6_9FUNG|nr:hypothetical protein BCR44DRAFT_1439381 [Catenaria anguillulae PL171]
MISFSNDHPPPVPSLNMTPPPMNGPYQQGGNSGSHAIHPQPHPTGPVQQQRGAPSMSQTQPTGTKKWVSCFCSLARFHQPFPFLPPFIPLRTVVLSGLAVT